MNRYLIVLLGLFLFLFPDAYSSTLINGAGATFPYPLYSKWFHEYQTIDKEVRINYQSIGSGGGIRQFLDKTIDFGATDVPMNEEQLKKATAPVLHIPTVLGSVVVSYNLSGLQAPLKLTPDVIADIFLGTIKKWEDARISQLNPGTKLSGDILVAHRSDGSGTTRIFTDYLSKVSPLWKQKVGSGTSVRWPVGLGGKGNEGVAGLIKQMGGSIGYVEHIYAASNNLAMASIKNKAGTFIAPSLAAVTEAAAGVLKTMPDDFRVSITDAEGKGSYPISSFTYLLVYKTQLDVQKGAKLVKFLKWAVKDGQALTQALHYSPLPKSLVSKVEAKIASIEVKKVN